MPIKLLFIFSLSLGLSACSTTARLYPVDGPLNTAGKITPVTVTVDGVMGNNGNMSAVLHDGTQCSGEWSSAAGVSRSTTSGSLISQYGPVYFTASTVSNNPGQNPGSAILLCTDSNVITVEFITGSGTANGFGIAKDKKGNIFKVLF